MHRVLSGFKADSCENGNKAENSRNFLNFCTPILSLWIPEILKNLKGFFYFVKFKYFFILNKSIPKIQRFDHQNPKMRRFPTPISSRTSSMSLRLHSLYTIFCCYHDERVCQESIFFVILIQPAHLSSLLYIFFSFKRLINRQFLISFFPITSSLKKSFI